MPRQPTQQSKRCRFFRVNREPRIRGRRHAHAQLRKSLAQPTHQRPVFRSAAGHQNRDRLFCSHCFLAGYKLERIAIWLRGLANSAARVVHGSLRLASEVTRY